MRLGSRPRWWSISPAWSRPRTRARRHATAFEPLARLANLDYVDLSMGKTRNAKFKIGQVVRPRKDQPFYHLFAENAESEYIAYVSEQNLLPDTSGEPVRHPQVAEVFEKNRDGSYRRRNAVLN